MTYNTDVGSNDEYTAQVPQAALVGATWVDVDVVFTDGTDSSEYVVATVRYNIVDVLPNDVTVSFTMCLGADVSTGDVCVIGSAAEIWDHSGPHSCLLALIQARHYSGSAEPGYVPLAGTGCSS